MFTHLHLHTEYSLLDGLPKIKDLVTEAGRQGMTSMAITDHGVMYGVIEFYKACKEAGIKPILGMEAYVTKGKHTDRTKLAGNFKDTNHLTLLAKNHTGYKNLMKLTSIAHLEGFYYKPRVDKPLLAKYSEGIICLSGCMASEVSEYLIAGEMELAKKTIKWFVDTYGADNYFLEIQRHQYQHHVSAAADADIRADLEQQQKNEDKLNQGIIELSREFGLPIVASNDVHYIKPNQAPVQDALVCIQTGKQVADTKRMRSVDTPEFYLKDPKEMGGLFIDLPEAILNTQKIADLCNVDIVLGEWYFPKFIIPGGKTAGERLREISYQGAEERFGKITKEISDRLDYELKVIEDRGYSPYFLIMGDMVNWCSSVGIVTTTRGSAAGSLVLFTTGITQVDPLKYQLPFERFLNPFRPSPPDIDLDIADNRRGDLIAHLTEQYGKEKVAQICTFGRMLARGSVRDVGRVLGFPYSFPDKISKAIPMGSQGFPMTIKKALKQSDELKTMYDDNADAKKLIDLAQEIEGNARHTSVHAAAVVISPTDMTDFSPLQKESGGEKIITQYEMHAAEEVGLIKFDILGIRNLAILNSAVDIVEATLGKRIDIKTIPIDDKKTFEMLARGETMGTFQLGGSGMTRYLMELKPERVEDLMAMVALFRPGPMANIPEYIKRKNDPQLVHYKHPKMEKYLKSSYGILVYQEDILFTALELAGYDWGSVDKFRKAIGKKIPEEMKKQEKIFIEGCQTHSKMTQKEAREIWDLFVPFQGYGFNKSHAAAYGLVAYQTAYLKANYPVEFMTAVLTAESGNTDKITQAIEECKRMDIPVLPPDINQSDNGFTIVADKDSKYQKAIRFGMSAIKNVGDAAIEAILEAREKESEFTSFTHFMSAADGRRVNKKVIESLIKVGAMDSFGNRAALLSVIDSVRDQVTKNQKQALSGQTSLFGGESTTQTQYQDKLPQIEEIPKAELLAAEKELLGFYLTDHPMAGALEQVSRLVTHKLSDLDPKLHQGHKVTLGGIPAKVRQITTKKSNQEMAFITLEDATHSIDVVVFPSVWAEYKQQIQSDQPIIITGKLDVRDDSLNLLAETIKPIAGSATVSTSSSTPVADHTILIPRGTDKTILTEIGKLLKASPGTNSLAVEIENGGSNKILMLPYKVSFTQDLEAKIQQLLQTTTQP